MSALTSLLPPPLIDAVGIRGGAHAATLLAGRIPLDVGSGSAGIPTRVA